MFFHTLFPSCIVCRYKKQPQHSEEQSSVIHIHPLLSECYDHNHYSCYCYPIRQRQHNYSFLKRRINASLACLATCAFILCPHTASTLFWMYSAQTRHHTLLRPFKGLPQIQRFPSGSLSIRISPIVSKWLMIASKSIGPELVNHRQKKRRKGAGHPRRSVRPFCYSTLADDGAHCRSDRFKLRF